MNGNQLYDYLFNHLVPMQVLYISRTGGLHTFHTFLNDGGLQFNIPNHQNGNNPNTKAIPAGAIISARNHFINNLQIETEEWLLANGYNWYGDCRIRILNQLIRLPEYLQNEL